MAFQVSPGVLVQEKDLTTIIPNVSTSIGGIVIAANKGPANDIVTVSTEKQLVDYFGKPSDFNASSWYTAANFLKYSGTLKVVRAIDSTSRNASVSAGVLIENDDVWEDFNRTGTGLSAVGEFAAKTPGVWGNNLEVSVCPSVGAFNGTGASPVIAGQIGSISDESGYAGSGFDIGTHVLDVVYSLASGGKIEIVVHDDNTVTSATLIDGGSGYPTDGSRIISKPLAEFSTSTTYAVHDTVLKIGIPYMFHTAHSAGAWNLAHVNPAPYVDIPEALNNNPGVGFRVIANISDVAAVPNTDPWKHADLFDVAPGTSEYATKLGGSNDEIYIVVSDKLGGITGETETVLETFICSKAKDVKSVTGEGMFYPDVLFRSSEYIYFMEHPTSTPSFGDGVTGVTYDSGQAAYDHPLIGGVDGAYPGSDEFNTGLVLFEDADTVDVNLIMSGPADFTYAQACLNLASRRKDCLAFISPLLEHVVGVANSDTQTTNVTDYYNSATSGFDSSSYSVFDSGWKYQYDTYNDVYRWVPLNGDLAGCCANTDDVADPWFSPAGMSRGNIKSVIKLAYNPTKSQRDSLYKGRINPVVTFPGMGTLLWGDKTAQAKASAFDRINVRRLFMVLEKAISIASRAQLFELNDDITRSNFVAMTEPFLRDVQGRRGITDFKVVCDTSNNTGDVIDRNEFRADIYIKPARSINFITLTFVATRTGVSFSEVGA